MAVRQVGTKGRHKEELAHNEDQGDGSYAEQVVYCRVMAHYQMTGNGDVYKRQSLYRRKTVHRLTAQMPLLP